MGAAGEVRRIPRGPRGAARRRLAAAIPRPEAGGR